MSSNMTNSSTCGPHCRNPLANRVPNARGGPDVVADIFSPPADLMGGEIAS